MFFAILFTLAIVIITYLYNVNTYFKKRNVKHIKPSLLFGNMFKVFLGKEHSLKLTKQLYENFPDEKYVGMYNFMTPVVLVKDLDLLKRMLVKDFDHFVDHVDFTDETVDPIQGLSLFALQGEKWKEMRSTLSPAFTSSKIRGMIPFVAESAQNVLKYLNNQADIPENYKYGYLELDTNDLSSRFANDVIASCAFGIPLNSLTDKTNQFYLFAKESTNFSTLASMKLFLFLMSPFLYRLFRIELSDKVISSFFRKLVIGNIEEREKLNINRPDMIHLLMLAKKGRLVKGDDLTSENSGFATVKDETLDNNIKKTQWTDDELTAQAVLFILAGFNTISTVLNYVFHELAANKDVQKKLLSEIDEYMTKTNGAMDYTEINKLKYLDMVISETLRLWPPLTISDRKCSKPFYLPPSNDDQIEGYTLNVGDGINIPVYDIQRDPKNFKNPDVFDPERFSDENKSTINPLSYMPFGYGPRACIGSRFALVELKIFTIVILSGFEVVSTPKTVYPVKIKPHFFELQPEDGFWIGLKKRSK